jgi:hypothetical protein
MKVIQRENHMYFAFIKFMLEPLLSYGIRKLYIEDTTEQLRRSSNTQHHFLPVKIARRLLHCYAYTFVCLLLSMCCIGK